MNNFAKRVITAKNLSYTDTEMYLFQQPVQLIQTDFFVDLTKQAVEDGNENTIYEVGRSSVKSFTGNVMNQNKMEKKSMVKFLERMGSSAGWGELKLAEIEEEPLHAVFKLAESPVSTRIDAEGKLDYILSGMIAGAIEEIYGKEIICEEAECVANGDPECRFVCKEV